MGHCALKWTITSFPCFFGSFCLFKKGTNYCFWPPYNHSLIGSWFSLSLARRRRRKQDLKKEAEVIGSVCRSNHLLGCTLCVVRLQSKINCNRISEKRAKKNLNSKAQDNFCTLDDIFAITSTWLLHDENFRVDFGVHKACIKMTQNHYNWPTFRSAATSTATVFGHRSLMIELGEVASALFTTPDCESSGVTTIHCRVIL